MRLFLVDVYLTRARLFGRIKGEVKGRRQGAEGLYPWGSPQEDLAEARRLIEVCGYHRRDAELRDAEEALGE
jgi:hypothetical protein